jgi:PAS domain S-box-containing protein
MKKKVSRKTMAGKRSAIARGGVRWVRSERLREAQDRLKEARETLDAIRKGEVDAVVVNGARGNQIYSLAGAEHPYRAFVEQMQEGAVTVSPDALVLFCNQRLAQMLKTPLERVISSKISSHLNGEAWETISRVFSQEHGVVKHQGALRCRDGSELPVNLTASRLPLEGKDVMCLVVTDLTAQKESAELRLGKELAEKANATKDDFLAALSHELRTPLMPVLISVAAMESDKTIPETARREIAMVRRNVELEARLIDDLLDLTRIARGKLELHPGPVDFHLLVRRAVEICRPDSDEKKQTIHFELGAREVRTEGDAVRIQQAIWNLIRNAVKFTPAGGSITVRTDNGDGHRIRLQIRDTGIGFDSWLNPRLFEAFEQGSRNITRQFGGLGLGLAITRSIIQSHGGTVHAESDGPGKGATFTLELPLRTVTADNSNRLRAPVPDADTSGLRLLLVEDHSDTRRSMESLLARHKHWVKSAASAHEALELAANNEFDLVISDLGLPDQSGLELMKELRDRFGLRGIGVSGYGMETDIAESRAAGFTCHLIKPVSMDRLRQAIAEVERQK